MQSSSLAQRRASALAAVQFRWRQDFPNVAKYRMDLDELVATGVVMESYLDVIWQDVEYMPQGKVACHLGHLNILRSFLSESETLGNFLATLGSGVRGTSCAFPGPPKLKQTSGTCS